MPNLNFLRKTFVGSNPMYLYFLVGSDEIGHGDQVLIISYNLVSKKERELSNWKFGVAILDERHLKLKMTHLIYISLKVT